LIYLHFYYRNRSILIRHWLFMIKL